MEDGDRRCVQYGNVDLLNKTPVDMLIVMDNSAKGRDLNAQITNNLTRFLTCMEPVDWRVGVVRGMEKDSSGRVLGSLMSLEIDGQASSKSFVSPRTKNYQKVFFDTISTDSGCAHPPYCGQGDHKPLGAVKSFMAGGGRQALLRGYGSFVVIVVSSLDEEEGGGLFSGTDAVDSQEVMSAVYNSYSRDQFMGLTVTDAGKVDDCIKTAGDFMSDGADFLGKVGTGIGIVTGNLWLMFGSQLASDSVKSGQVNRTESALKQFAQSTGGYVFDICKPNFGPALAYGILKKLNMENRFPRECMGTRGAQGKEPPPEAEKESDDFSGL